MSPQPFPDTASRGSQTESPIPLGKPIAFPPTAKLQSLKRGVANNADSILERKANFPSITISRLISIDNASAEQPPRPKKRRTIPMSNRAAESPTRDQQKFDLRDFACTFTPGPHSDYNRFNNDLDIERYTPRPSHTPARNARASPNRFPTRLPTRPTFVPP